MTLIEILVVGFLFFILIMLCFNKKEGYYLQDLPNGFGGWPPKIYSGKDKEFVDGQEIDFAPEPKLPMYDMYGEPSREGDMGYNAGLGYTWN